MQSKWKSSIGRWKKNDDHPYEDLTKSNYLPNMKYKMYLINFKLLKTSKLVNDHWKIKNLKIKFNLRTSVPYYNRY
jgi:hypothetical protein